MTSIAVGVVAMWGSDPFGIDVFQPQDAKVERGLCPSDCDGLHNLLLL